MNTATATMNDEPMPDPTTDERAASAAPPPPRPSWWHVPIARDKPNKKVGGVIAGVANAYGFDLRTTRFAVAVATLALPGVLALYISAMIFLPSRTEDAASLRDIVTERRRRPLLVVLVLLALFSGFGSSAFFGGFGWGVTLIGLGVVLWLSPNFGSGWRAAEVGTSTSAGAHRMPTPSPHSAGHLGTDSSKQPRRRYPIQAISLALGFATALVLSIGNNADWWTSSVYAVVMTVLAILVAGTVIGAVVNRSWFGIPMLIVLCACATALMVTHPNLDGGFADRTLRPITVADAEVRNEVGIGRLRIDLTDLPVSSDARTVTVQAEIGFGEIRIIVPADAELRIDSHVGAGRVVLDGEEITAGVRHDDARVVAPKAPGPEANRRTIVLDLDVGAGEINIARQP